jgi:hypothetical protein
VCDEGVDDCVLVDHLSIVVPSVAIARSLSVQIVALVVQFTLRFLRARLVLEMRAAIQQQTQSICNRNAYPFVPDAGGATLTGPLFAKRLWSYAKRILANFQRVCLPECGFRESGWWCSSPLQKNTSRQPPKQLQFAYRFSQRDTVCDIAVESVAATYDLVANIVQDVRCGESAFAF